MPKIGMCCCCGDQLPTSKTVLVNGDEYSREHADLYGLTPDPKEDDAEEDGSEEPADQSDTDTGEEDEWE